MKLYEQMAQKYQTEIERLRKANADFEQANAEMLAFEKQMESVPWEDQEAFEAEAATLERKLLGARQYLDLLHSSLTEKVNEWYWDVPFTKPVEQGKEAFWKIVWAN